MHNSSTPPPLSPSKPAPSKRALSTQRASPVFFFCGKSPCPNSDHANPANLHCHYKDGDDKTPSLGYHDDSETASSGYRDDSEKASSGYHDNSETPSSGYRDDNSEKASLGYRDNSEAPSIGYHDDSEKASSGHHDDNTGSLNEKKHKNSESTENLNRRENSNEHRASPDHRDDCDNNCDPANLKYHDNNDTASSDHHDDDQTSYLDHHKNCDTASLDYHNIDPANLRYHDDQENPDSASLDHHGDSETASLSYHRNNSASSDHHDDSENSADSAEKLRDFAERLPLEMSEKIFGELDTESLCSAAQTCKAWHDIIEESECLWRSQCLVIRAVCHREVDGDRGDGLSWKVTLVRNYTRGCLKRDWLRGRYSNVKSADDLIGRKMTPLDAETWGEILQAELDR